MPEHFITWNIIVWDLVYAYTDVVGNHANATITTQNLRQLCVIALKLEGYYRIGKEFNTNA